MRKLYFAPEMLEFYIKAYQNNSASLLFPVAAHLLQTFSFLLLSGMTCQQLVPLEPNLKPNSLHL